VLDEQKPASAAFNEQGWRSAGETSFVKRISFRRFKFHVSSFMFDIGVSAIRNEQLET
jgi:hypothetical protein